MATIRKFFFEHRKFLIILLLTWGLYFIFLFGRIIKEDSNGIHAGHEHVWGDWAIHTIQVNTFAHKSPEYWFAYHPIYGDGKATYPFLTNMTSGMLIRLGFSFPMALIIPSITFSLLLILGMYIFFYLILKSKTLSVIALSLYFLTAGPGFINFIKDFIADPSWEMISFPAKEYSRANQYEWGTGNTLIGMLVPQRSFLIGLMLSVWALIGIFYSLKDKTNLENKKWILLGSGILVGLLPIAHPHSLIAMIAISIFIALLHYKKWRLLLWYAIPSALISGALYKIFISGGIESTSFRMWFPGWTAEDNFWNWLKMWWVLWGVMLPLAIVTFISFFKKLRPEVKGFFLACFTLFGITNLYLLQPVHWDNSKIFVWAYFGFCALAAMAIGWFWNNRNYFSKSVSVVLIIFLASTGVLELIRLQRVDRHTYQFANQSELQTGKWIRDNTSPLARFSISPSHHNTPAALWGVRPILIGFPGWAWNFGFNFWETFSDVQQLYLGGSSADSLLAKHQVSYLLIGPNERSVMKANETYFDQRFPVVYSNLDFKIYDTRELLR